ncbi:MAG TPA: hypothetical protein VKV38_14415 [Trebonia sp.]|jgi:hypothetical protein|nr:hypothetical protein [Trebonia sp.]
MHVSPASVVLTMAVLCAWGMAALYCYRCARRRGQWQARWERFASGHRDLDRDLSRIWHLLRR